MNPEITKIIDQYLQGELSEEDKLAFEKKLAESEMLRKETELQKAVYDGAARAAIRTEVKKAGKSYHFTKTMQIVAGAVIMLAVSAALVFYIFSHFRKPGMTEEMAALIQKLEYNGPIDDLKSEFFIWNGKDAIAMSSNGVLLSIPENAFLLNGQSYKDQAVIQWQEAQDGATIMKSGLNTMSGGRLLETQGMFSIQAYTPDGKKLSINKNHGIYAQVPVDEYKRNMQLFTGQKNTNGMIDWVNPKPLMKIPVPVDMNLLDFYPRGYEDTLNYLKLSKDKRFRDSLYLSMEHFFGTERTRDMMGDSIHLNQEPGKSLFSSECMTCHSMTIDGTGPALRKIREKWSMNGAKEGSIYQWVQNWQVAASKDPYALNVSTLKPTAMRLFPKLTMEQISSIFDYIDSQPYDGIPPSMVLGFWNQKFNNTILATREFERRMPFIHATCNKNVLKLYIDNLSKPMVELDKQASEMGYSDFTFFASEQIGSMNSDNPHLKNLQLFYQQAIKMLHKEIHNNHNELTRKQEKWDSEVSESRIKEQSRTSSRKVTLLNEEYKFNMRNVQQQLSKSVGFEINGTGTIYNIDSYVIDAVSKRTSTTIVDPATGKIAKIGYHNLAFEIENDQDYRDIYAYILPSGINSYERILGQNGQFTYSFNDDMQYDLVIVGISENGYAYFQQTDIDQEKLGKIRLNRVSEAKLNASIEQINFLRVGRSFFMKDELQWLIKEQQDYKEQRNRQEQEAFRERIMRIIFPCFNMEEDNYVRAAPFAYQ